MPDMETGEMTGTFAIITRDANSLMAKIHNSGQNSSRMLLILTKELAEKWLDEKLTDDELEEILSYEFPASKLEAWPVNTIRTRKTDDESVIKKAAIENLPDL